MRLTIWQRGLIVSVVLAVVLWMAWKLRQEGPGSVPILTGCHFRKWTGLACPGCGMTRATSAALNGRVIEAFTLNPLGLVLLPVALTALVPELISWIAGKGSNWRLQPGRKISLAILLAILGFWVARNLPVWPWPV